MAHLRDGEQLLWVGQPDPHVIFTAADGFLVPFSVFWCGFVVVWETMVIVSRAPFFFVIWGIPFILIGAYFLFGRFIVKKRRKLATAYGLTPSRAIVCTGERSFADTPVKGMPTRVSRSRDCRHASVTFGYPGPMGLFGMYQNTGLEFFTFGMGQSVGFFDVENPDSLMLALDQAQAV